MKPITKLLLTAALTGALLLSGCASAPSGGGAGYTKEQAQEILDTGAFTDDLEELDCDTAWALYGLEGAGLERDQLADGLIRRSAGATCEELALLIFTDDASAATAKTAMADYVQSQIDSNRDYRPQELPKLEDAFLQQSGDTVLLVVSNDSQAVSAIVG